MANMSVWGPKVAYIFLSHDELHSSEHQTVDMLGLGWPSGPQTWSSMFHRTVFVIASTSDVWGLDHGRFGSVSHRSAPFLAPEGQFVAMVGSEAAPNQSL